MSITMYTGRPGCGKTYRVMYEMLKIKNQEKYYVFHNIPGFNEVAFEECFMGVDFNAYCEREGITRDQFFDVDYQTDLAKQIEEKYKRSMLIVIDEAHTILQEKNAVILKWLSYHRHINQTVWIISQSEMNVHIQYRRNTDLFVKGMKGALIHGFIYKEYLPDDKKPIRTTRLKKSKQCYAAYKSFDTAEGSEAKKSYFLWFVPVLIVGIIAGFVYGVPAAIGVAVGVEVPETEEEEKEGESVAATVEEAVDGDLLEEIPTIPTRQDIRLAGMVRGRLVGFDLNGLFTFAERFPGGRVVNLNRKVKRLLFLDPIEGVFIVAAGALAEEDEETGEVSYKSMWFGYN